MTDREKFEAWLTDGASDLSKMLLVDKFDSGGYTNNVARIQWEAWQAALASQQPADDSRNEMLSMPDMVTAQDMRETLNILLHEEEAEAAATGFNQCLMECAPIYEAYIRRSRCIDELVKELDGMQESLNAKHRSFVAARNRADLAEKKLAAPDSLQSADDGWIEWAGGECPVGPEDAVEVKCKNVDTYKGWAPETYGWEHFGLQHDVIAYRVVKP